MSADAGSSEENALNNNQITERDGHRSRRASRYRHTGSVFTLEAGQSAVSGRSANRFATPYPCGSAPKAALLSALMPPVGFAFEIDRKILP